MARLVIRRPTLASRGRQGARCSVLATSLAVTGLLIWPVLLAGLASPVSAHSELLLSVPAAGSILPSSPTQISLVFSEPLEARLHLARPARYERHRVTTATGQVDYFAYATASRAGVLLTARLVVALVAGMAVMVLARRPSSGGALAVGGLAASAEIGLIAAGGHAAAFSSPLPVAVDIVHVGAAGIYAAWIEIGDFMAIRSAYDVNLLVGGTPR